MMMPANYSVIAENEMTYVVGGGLFDILPDVMTSANWKTLNTNLVKMVGNYFLPGVVGSTLGVMFGGNWGTTQSMFVDLTKGGTVADKTAPTIAGYYTGKKDDILNAVMGTIGGLAAVYTLGTGDVKLSAPTLDKAIQTVFG